MFSSFIDYQMITNFNVIISIHHFFVDPFNFGGHTIYKQIAMQSLKKIPSYTPPHISYWNSHTFLRKSPSFISQDETVYQHCIYKLRFCSIEKIYQYYLIFHLSYNQQKIFPHVTKYILVCFNKQLSSTSLIKYRFYKAIVLNTNTPVTIYILYSLFTKL